MPLPADGLDATALPGLRAAPTDVALADAGCQQTTDCMPLYGIDNLHYEERLKHLGLIRLDMKREGSDSTEPFKIISRN